MAVRIQFRRDTAANWESVNPVLAEGELGLETDTSQYKIGDGTSNWNTLQYSSLPSNAINSDIIDAKGDILVGTADNTISRFAVGQDGQALIADSNESSGVRWGEVATSGDDDQIILAMRVFS